MKGYICNCNAGRRVVGSCVHVATIISYLSYIRYSFLRIPAVNNQKIFFDKNSNEPPNRPRYVKNKRDIKNEFCHNLSSSSEESDFENEKITIKPALKKQVKNSNKKKKSESINTENRRDNFIENSLNEGSLISIQEFISHVPKWGGSIEKNNKKIKVTNTCTIDYYLFAFWFLFKISPNFLEGLNEIDELKTQTLKNIIQNIDKLNWNKAKELWILKIMNIEVLPEASSISLFGSELNQFTRYLSDFQKHQIIQKCKLNCVFNENLIIREDSDVIYFKKLGFT